MVLTQFVNNVCWCSYEKKCMVDWIMTFLKCPCSIPRTCEHITLHDQRNLEKSTQSKCVIKWRTLRWGGYSGLPGGSNLLIWILKSEEPFQTVVRRRKNVREIQHCWFWSGERGSQVKECRQPLEAGKARTDSALEPPEETGPADTLTLAQGEGFWTPDLQNCKVISLYRFKPLRVWWFVTATIEN